MFETGHPGHQKLREIGKEITEKVKPKAVVVFSAHWQSARDVIEVNTSEVTDLIYDFYGFPDHYYDLKYPNVGSKLVAEEVISLLQKAGIKAKGVSRGLDHGVWAGFMCSFDPKTNPLNIPIIQVSLFASNDPDQHYALGQAISSLRTQNIQIIASGMAVHNLRDYRLTMKSQKPYTESFDEALKDAVEAEPGVRQQKMRELLKRGDARQAHPTLEHLLPVHVAAGAAGEDRGRRLWTHLEGSMSWAQYRFGELPDLKA